MKGIRAGILRDAAGVVNNSKNAALLDANLRVTAMKVGKEGIVPTYKNAAHHLIPTKVAEGFEAFLNDIGYRHNHPTNGVWMRTEEVAAFEKAAEDSVRHAGNHRGYSAAMGKQLQGIHDNWDTYKTVYGEAKANAWAQQAVAKLQSEARKRLTSEQIPIVAKGSNTTQDGLQIIWKEALKSINYGVP